MLMRYWARATDSLFPVMLIVRSRLAGASRSSQLEIRIIAPDSCLKSNKYYFLIQSLINLSFSDSPDFRHLGSTLSDDAADELVGDGHLVGLLSGGAGLAGEEGQRRGVDHTVADVGPAVDHVHRKADFGQLKQKKE